MHFKLNTHTHTHTHTQSLMNHLGEIMQIYDIKWASQVAQQ